MIQKHPITPPFELVEEWFLGAKANPPNQWVIEVATQAARWGSDQELEAICEWLSVPCPSYGREIRKFRRPICPSLKDEVKEIIQCLIEGDCVNNDDAVTLRRALEFLPE